MGISFKHRGSFVNTERFFKRAKANFMYWNRLEKFGQIGVDALASVTPVRSGLTADSWSYEIVETEDSCAIYWTNNNVQKGWYNVAIGIQLGHATKNGGWVEGIDYINPAIQPIFEKIADDFWMTVIKS